MDDFGVGGVGAGNLAGAGIGAGIVAGGGGALYRFPIENLFEYRDRDRDRDRRRPSPRASSSQVSSQASSIPAGPTVMSNKDNNDDDDDLAPGGVPRSSMNKLVFDYLVTEGFKEAAEKFREEAGLPGALEKVDLASMDNRIKVRNAVQCGRIEQAIQMVHQLYPELLDDDRVLFFKLQQQQLIELIRENNVEGAVDFASNHLAERGEEDPVVLHQLERTMALLAFENPLNSPFSDLLAPSHRQKVASELNAAILKAEHAKHTQPRLGNVLKLILWGQDLLDKRNVRYKKLTDLMSGRIEEPK